MEMTLIYASPTGSSPTNTQPSAPRSTPSTAGNSTCQIPAKAGAGSPALAREAKTVTPRNDRSSIDLAYPFPRFHRRGFERLFVPNFEHRGFRAPNVLIIAKQTSPPPRNSVAIQPTPRVLAVAALVELRGISDFRTVFNTCAHAGQHVFHVHARLLSGRPTMWPGMMMLRSRREGLASTGQHPAGEQRGRHPPRRVEERIRWRDERPEQAGDEGRAEITE